MRGHGQLRHSGVHDKDGLHKKRQETVGTVARAHRRSVQFHCALLHALLKSDLFDLDGTVLNLRSGRVCALLKGDLQDLDGTVLILRNGNVNDWLHGARQHVSKRCTISRVFSMAWRTEAAWSGASLHKMKRKMTGAEASEKIKLKTRAPTGSSDRVLFCLVLFWDEFTPI